MRDCLDPLSIQVTAISAFSSAVHMCSLLKSPMTYVAGNKLPNLGSAGAQKGFRRAETMSDERSWADFLI